MCDFLRKEKDALLSEPFPVTSSSGSVASPNGVKRKAVDNPEEPEKRQKKESTSEQSSKTSLTILFYIITFNIALFNRCRHSPPIIYTLTYSLLLLSNN